MHVSQKLGKALLSLVAIAMVLAAPEAFAKKDLFANDPGATQSPHTEQLAPNSSAAVETVHEQNSDSSTNTKEKEHTEKPKAAKEAEKPPSYLEQQFSRFKSNLTEAKDDLFGGKKSAKKEAASVPQTTEALASDTANSTEEIKVPTISAAEAAQRAQTLAEGQVINVRKYQDEGNPRYAVKLLQKNGRMKTINLDAVNGALIEDTPIEATPQ